MKLLLFKLLLFARTAWSWLSARLAKVSRWLVIAGLGLIAYGIAYYWKGLPYPVVMLMACSGYGTLVLGAGLSLRRPETTATLVLATVSFALSLVLLLVTQPGSVFSFGLFAFIGMLSSFLRLRQRRGKARAR